MFRKKAASGVSVDWSKPFTKKDFSRLRAVCDVVREALIGPIPCDYRLAGKSKENAAAYWIPGSGWFLKIHFYDGFFDRSLENQLYTIVHEHVHVMEQPTDQALARCERLVPKKYHDEYWERIHVAREITVERAAGALMPLLLPKIAEVL